MKKLFSIILILSILTVQNAFAETVSVSDAQKVAQSFFSNSNATRAAFASIKLVWDGNSTRSGEAPFYVFNSGNDGFVVISGDNGMVPILGYSVDGAFDATDIPDGLKVLLDGYRKNADALRNGKARPDLTASRKWTALLSSSKLASEPVPMANLNTALWGQSDPYNNDCPIVDESNCLTGCGATSLAILMRYYKYPSEGYGTLPEYTTTQFSIKIPEKTLGYSYQWDQMPLTYGETSTDEQKAAVAALMADIGHAIHADYGILGTSAYTHSILPAVLEHMKYCNKAPWKNRNNYTTEAWVKMLKAEINEKRPIYYRGESYPNGGHFFIIDGYDSEDRLHFNWGWKGLSNGYFYISDTEYSLNESAIIGLVPDTNWTAPTTIATLSFYNKGSTCFGLWAKDAYIKNYSTTTIYLSVINNGSAVYNGKYQVRLRHFDKTEEIIRTGNVYLDPLYYRWFSFPVTFDEIKAGDEIVAYYLDDTHWELIDNGSLTLPLRYNLLDVLSMNYENESGTKYLRITGMTGMTITCPTCPEGDRFTSQVYELMNPVTGDYTISNGNESYSVHLTF